jgi:tetratricopeptide (TPR) repeat protein
VTGNPRIEDLRRRVHEDPASIAFAQLAEEYRRAGDCEEAIKVCEAGLALHPAYLSARVTLGRALFELGRYEEARAEFLRVLDAAPDNQTAFGTLAEIDRRTHRATFGLRGDAAGVAARQSHRSSDDRVLAELEAWLAAITQRRFARHR